MAITRINQTGRQRLRREHTQVTLKREPGEPTSFDIVLTLDPYKLPADAKVFVEAYRQTDWMRFEFGTVAALSAPAARVLTAFGEPAAVRFRVRVTELAPPRGRLLAEGDQIEPREAEDTPDKRKPLLPVRPANLDQQLWRIDFDSSPVLEVNTAVGDWTTFARSVAFVTLVYPAVLREILNRILIVLEYEEEDDPTDWKASWIRFTCSLPNIPQPPVNETDNTARLDWIDEAVAAFAVKTAMLERAAELIGGDDR